MSMIQDELALKEYESLQAEKRDRMQGRLQVWSLLMALIGAFGLASVQSGPIGLVIGLYPLLAACIARYSGHNEVVIEKIKGYLLKFEEMHGYSGYEHYNQQVRHARSGHHVRALRDALLITSALATLVIMLHLLIDQQVMLAGAVALIELLAMVMIVCDLREKRHAK